jgi:hypothetical protein
MLTAHSSHKFAVIALIVYSMAAYRSLFANIHHYAGRSDLLCIITFAGDKGQPRQFLRCSIPCRSAWTEVLTCVLVQDG